MFKLLQDFAVKEFFPTSRLTQESKGLFLLTSYIQGQVRESQRSHWVRQGWSITTKRGREKVKKKKRKEKDQGRREGGSSKGKVPCALHQEFLFLVHKYLSLEAAHLGWSIGSYEIWSTRKQYAKEVPETDYFTQQKQYLKRTTLRTYSVKAVQQKGLLYAGWRSRCEASVARKVRTIAWAKHQQESCHLTSDNQPLFTSWKFLWWFHTWAILRSFANAKKCQLKDFCEKERYESCSVQRTFTADAFHRRRKREKSTVVMLLPDSHEHLAFEKPTRSVPETWGHMYDVLELRN